MSLETLSSEDRLQLMRFVCAFAWADLEVQEDEKSLVVRLGDKMGLSEDEKAEVKGWLKRPPRPEDIDPNDIPEEHRQLFLSTALQMVGADGHIDEKEMEILAIFEQLLR